jgi:hypothetical protein
VGRSWAEEADFGMTVLPLETHEDFVNTALQIYKTYSELTLIDIMRREHQVESIPSLLFSGLPTVLAYHISDWVGFVAVDVMLDDDEKEDTRTQLLLKRAGQIL